MSKNSETKKFSTLIEDLIEKNEDYDGFEENDEIEQQHEEETIINIPKHPILKRNNSNKSSRVRSKCYFNFNLRSLLFDYQEEIRIILMTIIFILFTNPSFLTIVNSYVPFFFETTSTISYNLYGRVFIGFLFALISAFMLVK